MQYHTTAEIGRMRVLFETRLRSSVVAWLHLPNNL
jgi:hypothetical protein